MDSSALVGKQLVAQSGLGRVKQSPREPCLRFRAPRWQPDAKRVARRAVAHAECRSDVAHGTVSQSPVRQVQSLSPRPLLEPQRLRVEPERSAPDTPASPALAVAAAPSLPAAGRTRYPAATLRPSSTSRCPSGRCSSAGRGSPPRTPPAARAYAKSLEVWGRDMPLMLKPDRRVPGRATRRQSQSLPCSSRFVKPRPGTGPCKRRSRHLTPRPYT